MRNKKIGHIISNGGTIKDIQKEIHDFPNQVTVKYFIELGYKKSTATTYCSLLNKNAQLAKMHIASDKEESSTEVKNELSKETIFSSENANFDNIIVDTSALGHKETVSIIENAKQVTFLHSTLQEMDRKKSLDKKSSASAHQKMLAYNIRLYINKILENSDKFLLSSFLGYNTNYVDDSLIQYLSILPKKIRPTLLTADKDLATRAKANDLEFIFKKSSDFITLPYSTSSKSACSSKVLVHEKPVSNELPFRLVKKYGFGIKIFTNGISNYIFSTLPQKITITLSSGECILYVLGKFTCINYGDTITVHIKSNNAITEHKFKFVK